MFSNHRYILSIPHNVTRLDEIPEGMPWEDIEFEDFQISKTDYDNLYDLFYEFNQSLDIFIDEYEEEEITADKISMAIQMTETYAAKASNDVKISTGKLLAALRRAAELKKPMELILAIVYRQGEGVLPTVRCGLASDKDDKFSPNIAVTQDA